MMDRLKIDIDASCLEIDKECRVLTIHGSVDEMIPVEDATEFDKIISNHKLRIVEGADHDYTSHQAELASIVLEFIKASLEQDKAASI
ncbi:Alpha/Beta hydrolase fold containing protein [Trema orientale]|uniref:Alpha/Beta hydrolase fold containing protein n=1 Tax=Trema orientale TaxID=63057 RepID=A0A2P5ALH7_TREOI|nr:Alpha/Beta hydrolase fold containing protein [Trema orientale]